MENTLVYNNPPYECDMTYPTNQQVLKKYQTWLEECDFQESIDVFKKLKEKYNEDTVCRHVLSYKVLDGPPESVDTPVDDYLLSKNPKNIIPLTPLHLHEHDQEYKRVSLDSHGVVGLYFDKPLNFDLEITFYICNPKWKDTIIVPKGTINYKLPRFICIFWLPYTPLLIKGMIPGSTLMGTIMEIDDQEFHTLESDRDMILYLLGSIKSG